MARARRAAVRRGSAARRRSSATPAPRRSRRGSSTRARRAASPGIVALEDSFHGRTFGALSVTGQPAKWAGFEPLVPDVRFARLNDAESLAAAAADGNVGCVLVEPIQGEGGINPATPDVPPDGRRARRRGAARCSSSTRCSAGSAAPARFFAFEQLGVRPDAVALAKGLANGLPIGALLVADEAPGGFSPGDHASTFGGNPVTCAAACAVLDAIDDELLDARARGRARASSAGLAELPAVQEVRGAGLLIGCELDRPAAVWWPPACEAGSSSARPASSVLRLTPPLVVSDGRGRRGARHPLGGTRDEPA